MTDTISLIMLVHGEKIAWVFVCLVLYWAYCVFWGVRGSIRARTVADYLLADRNLPTGVFVLAVTATSFSGWTFIGHPGLIYRDGLPYGFASLYAVTIPFTGVLFLKRQWLLGRHFGFITPAEMFAHYFQSRLIRVLVVVVALMFSVPYLGLQLRAAGFLLNVITHGLLAVEFGMWVLTMVMLSYVASGGLRTVAHVGALQALMIGLGITLIGLATLILMDGWANFTAALAALIQTDPLRTPAGHSHYVAIPGVIQFVADGSRAAGGAWTGVMNLSYSLGLMGIMASPAFTMWAFASRSPRAFAPQQVWASAGVMGLILVVFSTVQGLGGHFLGADRAFLTLHEDLARPLMVQNLSGVDLLSTEGRQDLLVPHLINLLGEDAPWLVGLLCLCALAAMESTASGQMITAGGILARDLLRPFVWPGMQDYTQRFVARLCITGVVLLALAVASSEGDALVLLGGLAVSYGLQMWPALIAICYWPFLTRQGVAAGLVSGLLVVTLTESVGQQWLGIPFWGRWPLTIHAAGWGIAANLLVAVVVSLFSRDGATRREEFHAVLRHHAALPPTRRRWIKPAWVLTVLWFLVALGPGAVLGNYLFGDPDRPASWWFGMPSLWLWQILAWLTGVGLLWFLAYFLGMGTTRDVDALKVHHRN